MFFTAKGLSPVSFEIYLGGEIPLIVSYLFSILNKETSKILLLLLALCISNKLFKKQYRQIVDRGNAYFSTMSQSLCSFFIHLYSPPTPFLKGLAKIIHRKTRLWIVEFGLFCSLEGTIILFLKWKRQAL